MSPALISHTALRELGLLQRTLVVDLGCPVAPAVPHLRLPGDESAGAAACLATGAALAPQRVRALLARGQRWGRGWDPGQPLLLAECVPGGTSTALAVLLGLGIAAEGLVSGSLRQPVHGLKAHLARRGLTAAGLAPSPLPCPDLLPAERSSAAGGPVAVLAAVGDPMQALAAGLVLAAAGRGVPVLLAGGSQMAAVLALALALAPAAQRPALAAAVTVATTAWVAEEADSDLRQLLALIGQRWEVTPQLAVAGLRFDSCRNGTLRDYERGYVKEGVGAGGVAVLWQWLGREPAALAALCDADVERLIQIV